MTTIHQAVHDQIVGRLKEELDQCAQQRDTLHAELAQTSATLELVRQSLTQTQDLAREEQKKAADALTALESARAIVRKLECELAEAKKGANASKADERQAFDRYVVALLQGNHAHGGTAAEWAALILTARRKL